MKVAATLLWSIAVQCAFAGMAFSADPRAAQLTYQPWMKVCIGKSLCFIGVDARGQCQPSGGSMMITVVDGVPERLSVSFGAKRGLSDAARFRIDDGDWIRLSPPPTCYPSGLCVSKLKISDDIVAQLRNGQTVTTEALDTAGQTLRLSFPLAEFARVYDGPGTEPEFREEIRSREETKELMEREEAEKRERECKE
jgi:invasion protein IalB